MLKFLLAFLTSVYISVASISNLADMISWRATQSGRHAVIFVFLKFDVDWVSIARYLFLSILCEVLKELETLHDNLFRGKQVNRQIFQFTSPSQRRSFKLWRWEGFDCCNWSRIEAVVLMWIREKTRLLRKCKRPTQPKILSLRR